MKSFLVILAPVAAATARPRSAESGVDCTGAAEGTYIPDPTDCSKFYVCSHGEAVADQCHPPLLFDASINVCNWPNMVECEATTTTTTTTEEATTTTTEEVETTTPEEVETTTPEEVETTTVEEVETTTEDVVETTTEEEVVDTTTEEEEPQLPIECPEGEYAKVADPESCQWYYVCQKDGSVEHKKCPLNMFFDDRINICNLPILTNCRN